MPFYIEQSGDQVRCHGSLTQWQLWKIVPLSSLKSIRVELSQRNLNFSIVNDNGHLQEPLCWCSKLKTSSRPTRADSSEAGAYKQAWRKISTLFEENSFISQSIFQGIKLQERQISLFFLFNKINSRVAFKLLWRGQTEMSFRTGVQFHVLPGDQNFDGVKMATFSKLIILLQQTEHKQ